MNNVIQWIRFALASIGLGAMFEILGSPLWFGVALGAVILLAMRRMVVAQ